MRLPVNSEDDVFECLEEEEDIPISNSDVYNQIADYFENLAGCFRLLAERDAI